MLLAFSSRFTYICSKKFKRVHESFAYANIRKVLFQIKH